MTWCNWEIFNENFQCGIILCRFQLEHLTALCMNWRYEYSSDLMMMMTYLGFGVVISVFGFIAPNHFQVELKKPTRWKFPFRFLHCSCTLTYQVRRTSDVDTFNEIRGVIRQPTHWTLSFGYSVLLIVITYQYFQFHSLARPFFVWVAFQPICAHYSSAVVWISHPKRKQLIWKLIKVSYKLINLLFFKHQNEVICGFCSLFVCLFVLWPLDKGF